MIRTVLIYFIPEQQNEFPCSQSICISML